MIALAQLTVVENIFQRISQDAITRDDFGHADIGTVQIVWQRFRYGSY